MQVWSLAFVTVIMTRTMLYSQWYVVYIPTVYIPRLVHDENVHMCVHEVVHAVRRTMTQCFATARQCCLSLWHK